MNEFDRVKDKVEILLDPRQVVMLALGTMVIAGALFAAGYVLGQRNAPLAPIAAAPVNLEAIDATARAARPPATSNPPLALGEVEFLFPSALTARPARKRPNVQSLDAHKVRLPEVVLAAPRPAPRPQLKAEASTETPERAAPDDGAKTAKPSGTGTTVTTPTAEPAEETESATSAADEKVLAEAASVASAPTTSSGPAKPVPAAAPATANVGVPPSSDGSEDADSASTAEDAPPSRPVPPVASGPERTYTLQVKSVPGKAEADAFVASLRRAGFEPYVVLADIPGRGRYYRVRVGRFPTLEAAKRFQRRYRAQSGQPDAGYITDL